MSIEPEVPDLPAVTKERMEGWTRLIDEHFSTPAVVISIGQSEENRGEVYVFHVHELKLEHVKAFIRKGLDAI